MERKKKRYAGILAGAAVIILAALIFFLNRTPQEGNDVLLREYPVSRGNITAGVDGSGKLKMDGIAQNFSEQVYLEALYVSAGDTVSAGDKIAKAQESTLQKELEDLQTSLKTAEIALASAEYEQANAQSAWEKASTARKTEAQLRLERCQNAVTIAQIEFTRLTEQVAQKQKRVDDPYLYADVDGVVLAIGYAVGVRTNTEIPVATIGENGTLYAWIEVSQADIVDVVAGQAVELTLSAYPERIFKGQLIKKAAIPTSDSASTYAVYVSLETEEDYALAVGMSCKALLIIKQATDVLQLSNKAIQLSNGKQTVLLKDTDGNLYKQEIQTGFSDGKYSEILSGLSEGDIVYVEG